MKASKIQDNLSKISKKAIGSNDPLNEQNPSNVFYKALWRLVDQELRVQQPDGRSINLHLSQIQCKRSLLLLNQMELNHHAKDFLSTESLLMNGLIHIPVNLIQTSWRPISLLAMHCGLVSGLSCVKGLIFSPSKTCCGTSHTI